MIRIPNNIYGMRVDLNPNCICSVKKGSTKKL